MRLEFTALNFWVFFFPTQNGGTSATVAGQRYTTTRNWTTASHVGQLWRQPVWPVVSLAAMAFYPAFICVVWSWIFGVEVARWQVDHDISVDGWIFRMWLNVQQTIDEFNLPHSVFSVFLHWSNLWQTCFNESSKSKNKLTNCNCVNLTQDWSDCTFPDMIWFLILCACFTAIRPLRGMQSALLICYLKKCITILSFFFLFLWPSKKTILNLPYWMTRKL